MSADAQTGGHETRDGGREADEQLGQRDATRGETLVGNHTSREAGSLADASAQDTSTVGTVVGRALGGVPTILVFAALAGVGYWGHHNGWRLPKFSELSQQAPAETTPWCDEHGVAAADCVACNAELMPKGQLHGWCREHGVHECVLHHPQLIQLSETPRITQADLDRAARAIEQRPRTKKRTCL